MAQTSRAPYEVTIYLPQHGDEEPTQTSFILHPSDWKEASYTQKTHYLLTHRFPQPNIPRAKQIENKTMKRLEQLILKDLIEIPLIHNWEKIKDKFSHLEKIFKTKKEIKEKKSTIKTIIEILDYFPESHNELEELFYTASNLPIPFLHDRTHEDVLNQYQELEIKAQQSLDQFVYNSLMQKQKKRLEKLTNTIKMRQTKRVGKNHRETWIAEISIRDMNLLKNPFAQLLQNIMACRNYADLLTQFVRSKILRTETLTEVAPSLANQYPCHNTVIQYLITHLEDNTTTVHIPDLKTEEFLTSYLNADNTFYTNLVSELRTQFDAQPVPEKKNLATLTDQEPNRSFEKPLRIKKIHPRTYNRRDLYCGKKIRHPSSAITQTLDRFLIMFNSTHYSPAQRSRVMDLIQQSEWYHTCQTESHTQKLFSILNGYAQKGRVPSKKQFTLILTKATYEPLK